MNKCEMQAAGISTPGFTIMNSIDHRRVIAELDVLSSQIAELMQRFEGTGFNVTMKGDYVSLHVLQHRVFEARLEHTRMIDETIIPCVVPTERH